MKSEELRRFVTRYKNTYQAASVITDVAIADVCPPRRQREIKQARKGEAGALRLLVIAEICAALDEDPALTALWMLECLQAGEVVERSRHEDAF
jgi:hypothetical protein